MREKWFGKKRRSERRIHAVNCVDEENLYVVDKT